MKYKYTKSCNGMCLGRHDENRDSSNHFWDLSRINFLKKLRHVLFTKSHLRKTIM